MVYEQSNTDVEPALGRCHYTSAFATLASIGVLIIPVLVMGFTYTLNSLRVLANTVPLTTKANDITDSQPTLAHSASAMKQTVPANLSAMANDEDAEDNHHSGGNTDAWDDSRETEPQAESVPSPVGSRSKSPSYTIHCVFREDANSQYHVWDLPARYCSSIVYCCLDVLSAPGPSRDGLRFRTTVSRLDSFRAVASHYRERLATFLALGGPLADYAALASLLVSPRLRFALSAWLVGLVLQGGHTGPAIFVHNPERLPKPRLLDQFLLEMGAKVPRLMVLLPADTKLEMTHLSTPVFARFGWDLVKAPWSPARNQTSCPNQGLPELYKESMMLYGTKAWPDVLSKMSWGISLAALSYRIPDTDNITAVGEEASLVGTTSYQKVLNCPRDNVRHLNVGQQQHCAFVKTSSNLWQALLGSSALDAVRGQLQSVTLFDMDADDFAGLCGPPHPLVRLVEASVFEEL